MFAATSGHADPAGAWRAFSVQGIAFVLPPDDSSRKILLMATEGAKGPQISLLDLEGVLCRSDRGSASVVGSFAVNGKPLGFVEDCVNGTTVDRPQNDAGQTYLRTIVAAGNAVTVDDGRGAPLRYPSADFGPVKQELQLRAYGF
jgi:hypothetical protein